MVNPVKFTVCQQPAQAMQIRLTAPLLEALRAAASMGQSASIRFGAVQQVGAGVGKKCRSCCPLLPTAATAHRARLPARCLLPPCTQVHQAPFPLVP